jgi:hypothetical protein
MEGKVKFQYLKMLAYFLFFAVAGCATMRNFDELMVLKSVADSQRDIEKYLNEQEKGFNRLLSDVKNNRLRAGVSKKYIIATYAEPVLVKDKTPAPAQVREVLLYRHPTQYFKSERVYLYLDKNFTLLSWEVAPAK